MRNKYIGEIASLSDHNTITVIFNEDGFSEMTSSLLQPELVVAVQGERRISSNLEIFFDVKINAKTIKIVGQLVPGFQYEDIF